MAAMPTTATTSMSATAPCRGRSAINAMGKIEHDNSPK
jgi:hypothetical protein